METPIKGHTVVNVRDFLLEENIIDINSILSSIVEKTKKNVEEIFAKFSNTDINPLHGRPMIELSGPMIKLEQKQQNECINYDLSSFSLNIYDKDPHELQELVETELLICVSTKIILKEDILIVPLKYGTQWFVEVDERIDTKSIAYQAEPMYYTKFLNYLEKLSNNDMLIGVSPEKPKHVWV